MYASIHINDEQLYTQYIQGRGKIEGNSLKKQKTFEIYVKVEKQVKSFEKQWFKFRIEGEERWKSHL